MVMVGVVTGWVSSRMQRIREDPERDRGSDILQTVVIIGLFVAAAIVVVAIIVAKATGAANNIQTQ